MFQLLEFTASLRDSSLRTASGCHGRRELELVVVRMCKGTSRTSVIGYSYRLNA